MQGSCHLETKASGQRALLLTCLDLVSGYIDPLSWLIMVMCVRMLEFLAVRALRGWVYGLQRIAHVDGGARP